MKINFYHIDAFEVPNYLPIWKALKNKGVDAHLVGVPGNRNTAEPGWFDFDRFKDYCNAQNLPFITEINTEADIAITTQNASILSDYHNLKIRLMYGPIIYPHAWGLQKISVMPFDYVLIHGSFYKNHFSKWLDSEKLPIIGYPRYDDFFSGKFSKSAIQKKWGMNDHRPVLVFLPTWGENSGFEKFFHAILKLNKIFNIIVKPHHCTLRLESERMQALKSSGLLILDNAFDLLEIYAGADLIVSDVRSGGLFEACLCDLPCVGLVMDDSDHWLLDNKIENMISLCNQPEQIQTAIDKAMTSHLQSQHRLEWRHDHVAFCDGHAADKAAEILIQIADKKKSRFKKIRLTPAFQTNLESN